MAVGEKLSPLIAASAQEISECFLTGGKLLVAGFSASRHLAAHFHYSLSQGLEFERPVLPAILLDDSLGPFSVDKQLDTDIFLRQINTLGKDKDALLIVSSGNSQEIFIKAIQTAHKRNINCFVLTGPEDSLLSKELSVNDRELSSATDNQCRNQEIQLLIILCLCELIEQHLFGGSTP